jgi:glutamyl-Q tRNA(Asp) synthetase
MGRVEQDVATEIGDFVLRRRDGLIAYQLAVVVDDADGASPTSCAAPTCSCRHPARSSCRERSRFGTPRYLHVPVASHADGRKLSKQTHAAPVDAARPREGLMRALQFLGQASADADTPAQLLANAVRSWQTSGIPRRPAVPIE